MIVDEVFYISHDISVTMVSPVSYSGKTNAVLLVGYCGLRVQDKRDCQQSLDRVNPKTCLYHREPRPFYLNPFYLIKRVRKSLLFYSILGFYQLTSWSRL